MKRILQKREMVKTEIKRNLADLLAAEDLHDYSYQKCLKIGIKNEYTPDELEVFEAMTSRFARCVDILTQKVLKSLLMLLEENPPTFIDKANLLEKLGIVEKADILLEIRELRNEIAHEYSDRSISELFMEAVEYTPMLKKIIAATKSYIKRSKA